MSILAREYQLSFHSYFIYAKSWQSAEANPELAPIILMHDSLGSVALWRDFPAQLAAQTQRVVYAYDRIGFGQSSVNDQSLALDFVMTEATHGFKVVLDYFDLKHFIVLGHSVGGGMSAAIAAEYPQCCKALVTGIYVRCCHKYNAQAWSFMVSWMNMQQQHSRRKSLQE
ncbi:alpha/beta fold hydrolase [Acinetobacter sp. ANC 4169]|uniref:alpha/beta fold hydrolase n=1 Tax=Acinetobacter sp. ANC 4169 TaxID=1977879 RepID=UPI001D0D1150|nr:alpha/beta fold hydrolase [Acinetobacter sp. ANC 4169]